MLLAFLGLCKIIPPADYERNFSLKDDFAFSIQQQKLKDHAWEDFGNNDLLFDVEKWEDLVNEFSRYYQVHIQSLTSCCRTVTLAQHRENTMKLSQANLGMCSRAPEMIVEVECMHRGTCCAC